MIKVLILSVIVLALAVIGLSIKLIFNRKAQLSTGCCNTASPGLKEKGVGCACGGGGHSEAEN